MTDRKRVHPMHAKYFLARSALSDAEWFFDAFGGADGSGRLLRLWELIGEDLPEQDRVAPDGVSAQAGSLGDGTPALVLSLPAPERNDAHFLAAVAGRDRVRVFCLERSLSFPERRECTVIAELAADHRANWGSGPMAQADAFMAEVDAIVSGARPGPLATTPMQLA